MRIKYTTDQREGEVQQPHLVIAKRKLGGQGPQLPPEEVLLIQTTGQLFSLLKKPCSPKPGSHSLSFSIAFLKTQFIRNTARSPGGKQKAGSKMKHLINREDRSTVARELSAILLAPWRR